MKVQPKKSIRSVSKKVAVKKVDKKVNKPTEKTSSDTVTRNEMMSWINATSEAMEAFDFEHAAECYAKLEWKWAKPKHGQNIGNCDMEIPTEEDIRNEVRKMIDTCIKGAMDEPDPQTTYHCSTGGLYVVAYKYPNSSDNWIWIGMTCVETLY